MKTKKSFYHEDIYLILSDIIPFFSRFFCGLLKYKVRILVTHQLQYIEHADKIIVMDEVSKIF